MFGARVCVKRSVKRRAVLNKHNYTGVSLGYMATMVNVRYIDLNSGLVKTCGHATFDEVWYCEATRPAAAQLLYELGLEADVDPVKPPERVAQPTV